MHDKMNDEETKENLVNDLNKYFNIDLLNIEDLNKTLNDCNLDDL